MEQGSGTWELPSCQGTVARIRRTHPSGDGLPDRLLLILPSLMKKMLWLSSKLVRNAGIWAGEQFRRQAAPLARMNLRFDCTLVTVLRYHAYPL